MTGPFRWIIAVALGALLAQPVLLRADDTNSPDFKTVYQLLLDNLPGATEASLNRAAVDGLLSQFPGQVSIVSDSTGGSNPASTLGKAKVLEGDVAYLRIQQVQAGLNGEVKTALGTLAATNPLAGGVLDLRFAGGDDLAAAQTLAQTIKSQMHPLTILVNGETHGAAESLAATLRTADAGLIIGSSTAGTATTFKELPLPNGERLRIATTNGPSATSVQPDIAVTITPQEELFFLTNPYVSPNAGKATTDLNTNTYLPFIDHTSEADLVRAKIKDGDEDETTAAQPTEPPKPFIHDPALARAVDLIKGLAALHPNRS